jgi:hypothetical protein
MAQTQAGDIGACIFGFFRIVVFNIGANVGADFWSWAPKRKTPARGVGADI